MLGYNQIQECIANKTEVWGYGFIPNDYLLKPFVLRKPEKGIIIYTNEDYFIPLNKHGKPIKSRKVQRQNMHFTCTEKEAIDEYNQLIDRHLKKIMEMHDRVASYKV